MMTMIIKLCELFPYQSMVWVHLLAAHWREVASQSVTDERQSLCRPTIQTKIQIYPSGIWLFWHLHQKPIGLIHKMLPKQEIHSMDSIQLSSKNHQKKLPQHRISLPSLQVYSVSDGKVQITKFWNQDKRLEDIMQRGRWRKTRQHSCEGTMKKTPAKGPCAKSKTGLRRRTLWNIHSTRIPLWTYIWYRWRVNLIL